MKTIIMERAELLNEVRDRLCAFFADNPNAVVTMAAGRTMLPIWKLLANAVRDSRISLKKVKFFQTAEFINAEEGKSLRRMTEELLLGTTDLQPGNCRWISNYDGKLDVYEADIYEQGGLDLALLGIGDNGHIGFNEPATQYGTRCRVQNLRDATKNQYAWRFGTAQDVPDKAYTMGIRTLTEAKKIMVLCLGKEKEKATFDMLYARDDSLVPAAFLQLPYDVTVFADEEAGAKL